MSRIVRTFFITASVLSVLGTACAAGVASERDHTAAKLFSKTGMKPDAINPSPIPGLFEVVVQRKIFYTDKDAKYLIAGKIFDTTTQTDITGERMAEISKIKWDSLPFKDAIKVVRGKGERRIAVFTDVRCRYCAQLEQSLQQIGNVTVYNFIYPILNSEELARSIYCAKQPAQAFVDHMLRGTDPKQVRTKCDSSAIDRNLLMGQRYGISGTPAIIFEDGTLFPGALPTEQLELALNDRKANRR